MAGQNPVHLGGGPWIGASYSTVRYARHDKSEPDVSDVEATGRRTRVFSAAAMGCVPYFASIVPHVRPMEPGLAEVTVPKWFFV